MDTNIDIAGAIDASFGDGPAQPPVAVRVEAGRRLVRRRRIGTGTGLAALALVIGGSAWALAPGGDVSSAPDPSHVAGSPTVEPTPTSTDPVGSADDAPGAVDLSTLQADEHATLLSNGNLWVRPGWKITERIPNPMGVAPPSYSVGVEVSRGDQRYWMLLNATPDGGSSASDPAGKSFATLNAWVAEQVALNPPDSSTGSGAMSPSPVWFNRHGVLAPVAGATIVSQRANPSVPGFAPAGATTAAARVTRQGATWFVLARKLADGSGDYFPVQAEVLEEPTMAAFLDFARTQYGTGEGLR